MQCHPSSSKVCIRLRLEYTIAPGEWGIYGVYTVKVREIQVLSTPRQLAVISQPAVGGKS